MLPNHDGAIEMAVKALLTDKVREALILQKRSSKAPCFSVLDGNMADEALLSLAKIVDEDMNRDVQVLRGASEEVINQMKIVKDQIKNIAHQAEMSKVMDAIRNQKTRMTG